MINNKINVKDKPIWEQEVVSCISNYYLNPENSVIENSNKFGFSKEQMHDFLDKYITYKDAVLNDILPVFNKKYSILEPYFKSSDLSNYPIFVGIVFNYGYKLVENISDEEIDDVIMYFLNEMYEDLVFFDEELKPNLLDITDVINLLNKACLDNDLKMNIINLYMNRYSTIRKLVELLKEFAPICEKYFFIIEDDFKKTINYINNIEDLNEVLKSNLSINNVTEWPADINISIMFFNQLSMRTIDGISTIRPGIYLFQLCELSEKNKYNDTQMVANLKALADSTRYSIVCMLSEKSMYMQEIADKLGLSAANVSHHINTLLQYEIISALIDSEKHKRIYYEINEKKIESLSQALKNIIKKRN